MKKTAVFGLAVLLAVAFVASAQAEGYKGYARGEALISPQELKGLIDANDPKLVIIAVASVPQYRSGHVPGAHQIWRPDYAADPKSMNGITDMLVQPEGFTKLMQKLGVNPDSKVVVYDHQYDATRIWWAFYMYGKTDVRVLDGGIDGWTAAGYETDIVAGGKSRGKGTWVATVANPAVLVDTAEVLKAKDDVNVQVWDNRANSEFCGDEIKSGAFRAGRIPFGVQADWPNLKSKDNKAEWLPAAEVQKYLDKMGFDKEKSQYFVCQSGVRTTQYIFTLYAMGWDIEKLRNYDGSWIAWSKDSSLELEKGCPDTTLAAWQQTAAAAN